VKKICSLVLASVFSLSAAHATLVAEKFATDPSLDGWQVFGDTNLFHWNAPNQNLEVTWDSSQTNSYFYHPLGGYITRNDDFSVTFDLQLNDIASGVEPGKTGPMQLGFGFLNTAVATNVNFMRGSFGDALNVVEFDYYPYGYYTDGDLIYDAPATTMPSFISGVNSYDYCPSTLAVYDNELPLHQPVHVTFNYTASNQTAVVVITTNGVPVGQLPGLILNSDNGFMDSDDFNVDMFSISSYSSRGDDYDSVLAHGVIANVVVTIPPPAQKVTGSFTNGQWQVQFTDHTNWLYALERSSDLQNWTVVVAGISGNGTSLTVTDPTAPAGHAFYRVNAHRP
jgi:hypothetical protein